jgi:hypothetical protein
MPTWSRSYVLQEHTVLMATFQLPRHNTHRRSLRRSRNTSRRVQNHALADYAQGDPRDVELGLETQAPTLHPDVLARVASLLLLGQDFEG